MSGHCPDVVSPDVRSGVASVRVVLSSFERTGARWSSAPGGQRACSSAWLEHTLDKRGVGSSNLPRPTSLRSCRSYGKPEEAVRRRFGEGGHGVWAQRSEFAKCLTLGDTSVGTVPPHGSLPSTPHRVDASKRLAVVRDYLRWSATALCAAAPVLKMYPGRVGSPVMGD